MSTEENPEQQQRHGGWQPIPQGGDYDAEATAFVHLSPEDLANDPLAAPGQGYVPPMILPLTPAAGLDPAAMGSWVVQTRNQQKQHASGTHADPGTGVGADRSASPDAVHWPDPNEQHEPYGQYEQHEQSHGHRPEYPYPYGERTGYEDPSRYEDTAAATGHWNFSQATSEAPAGGTGQWAVPAADGELPEDSGEFATSSVAAPWYGDASRPATLPGGAPAPWATLPEPEAEAPHEPRPEEPQHEGSEHLAEPERPDAAQAPEPDALPHPADEGTAVSARPEAEPGAEAEPPVAAGATETAGPTADATADAGNSGAGETAEAEGAEVTEDGPDAVGATADAPAPETTDGPDTASTPGTTDVPDAPALADTTDTTVAVHPGAPSEHPAASYLLHVNGVDRPVTDAWIGESLLYVLRERLGLAGAKDGCSQGECGACNVQVDGRLVASCLVPAATTAGSEVRTVEGLAVDGEPSDVQRALANCGAVQCGFCIPGMAMTVHDLLEGNHAPSELETRQALCGNLCRCSGYRGVLDAVGEVIAAREASAEAAADAARVPQQATAPGVGGEQHHQHQPQHEPHPHDGGMA
ncbi:2Fe-2S iron-sulfur cluster-binding protein [Streptomyces sp. DT171]|uniref:(2Fe-2S)-binding protein n=1 Tax=Streptomyces sp. DT171 TaxID=3416524 RepID=UPI003CEC8E2A